MLKEITVLSQGDANSSKTWSNIPFYLVAALKQEGYKVNTYDVTPSNPLKIFIDKIFCRLLRHSFLPGTTYSYDRTNAFQRAVGKHLKRAVNSFPNTDLFISTSFSFLPSDYTDKPCALLCDWTYEYWIRHFKKRTPDVFELRGIAIQEAVIKKADYVFSLFPDIAEYMKNKHSLHNIYYLGNVINSFAFDIKPSLFARRLACPRLVFVGLPKYLSGLMSLISAVNILHSQGINIYLDVIGMEPSDISITLPSYVTFHGYLEKSNHQQNDEYKRILNNSIAFINTTPEWAGFSSTLEAMYYGLPIYTSKYTSFIETFGDSIEFGDYCLNNTPEEITNFVTGILSMNSSDYTNLCLNARKKAEPFTWSAYIISMLTIVNDSISTLK